MKKVSERGRERESKEYFKKYRIENIYINIEILCHLSHSFIHSL